MYLRLYSNMYSYIITYVIVNVIIVKNYKLQLKNIKNYT